MSDGPSHARDEWPAVPLRSDDEDDDPDTATLMIKDLQREIKRLHKHIAELEAELAGIMSTSTGVMLAESQEREARHAAKVIELQAQVEQGRIALVKAQALADALEELIAAVENVKVSTGPDSKWHRWVAAFEDGRAALAKWRAK